MISIDELERSERTQKRRAEYAKGATEGAPEKSIMRRFEYALVVICIIRNMTENTSAVSVIMPDDTAERYA